MGTQIQDHPDAELIKAIGGTCAVAKLCEVKPQAVSQWRKKGIPDARRMYLELTHPMVFGKRAIPATQRADN